MIWDVRSSLHSQQIQSNQVQLGVPTSLVWKDFKLTKIEFSYFYVKLKWGKVIKLPRIFSTLLTFQSHKNRIWYFHVKKVVKWKCDDVNNKFSRFFRGHFKVTKIEFYFFRQKLRQIEVRSALNLSEDVWFGWTICRMKKNFFFHFFLWLAFIPWVM